MIVSVVFTLLPNKVVSAGSSAYPEGKIKAALIYNFMRFVDWPVEHSITGELCVLGQKQEYQDALLFLSRRELKNTTISLRILSSKKLDNLTSCQVVFVTSDASVQQKQKVLQLAGKPTLIIGDETSFLGDSGMINFVKKQKKIGFEVNLANVQAANIRISSKVLRLAEKVIE
jgi:hypothetical protein